MNVEIQGKPTAVGAGADVAGTQVAILPARFAIVCPGCGKDSLCDGQLRCRACGFAPGNDGRICVLEYSPVEQDYSEGGAAVQQEVRESHFWFSMRNLFILRLMSVVEAPGSGRRFVEYGCSNGLVMHELERAGWRVLGADMHLGGLRNAAGLVEGPLVCAPLERIRFQQQVDAIGFFDVIEHLAEDRAALQRAVDELVPGGHLVVTVPAFPSLWSSFDVLLGHKRRYTAADLTRLFRSLDLEIVTVRYAFSLMFPLVWLQRKLVREAPAEEQRRAYYRAPHPLLNTLLIWCCRLELALSSVGVHLPFGTSVMAVARKPGPPPSR